MAIIATRLFDYIFLASKVILNPGKIFKNLFIYFMTAN